MKITFLGTKGSLQTKCDFNTSLLVEAKSNSILIDCSGSLSRCAEACPSDIIITHEHIDHLYGLPSLLHQMWLSGRKDKLTIHARGEALKLVSELIDLFCLRGKKGIYPIELEEIAPFSVEDMDIEFFETAHTPNSFGLVFSSNGKKVVYTSDTRPISSPSSKLENADVLITEASGLESDKPSLVDKGHQSGRDAAMLSKCLNADALYLVHMPISQEKCSMIEKEAREVFPRASIASMSEVIEI